MLEKNGQEIHVTVWASNIELIKNIGNVSSLIIFSHPSPIIVYMFDISLCWAITLPYFHCSYTYFTENGMQVCIYDAKVRKDEITLRWLETAVANIYFYHGTVVKVKKKILHMI